MNIPSDLRYTKEHEWVKLEGNIATIGITNFAQSQLGDIVYVDITSVGDTIEADGVFGTVEAVKTVSELYMPLTGEVIEKNEELDGLPENVNNDPYGSGWMIKVKVSNPSDYDNLLDADAYERIIN